MKKFNESVKQIRVNILFSITTLLLIFSYINVSGNCELDVYIRPTKGFDGSQVTMSFSTGKELNEIFKSNTYKNDKLYAYYDNEGTTKLYEIIEDNTCGDVAYGQCINGMKSIINAKDVDGKLWKIIVYK
tara:strand:- start:195 stop:584 length:390 start_codon:yes stop_codon:yes gene_type:complete